MILHKLVSWHLPCFVWTLDNVPKLQWAGTEVPWILLPGGNQWAERPFTKHSRAPSIRYHRGTKVVFPDFQPMRVSKRTGLHLSLPKKSSLDNPAFEISCSWLSTLARFPLFPNFLSLVITTGGGAKHRFISGYLSSQMSFKKTTTIQHYSREADSICCNFFSRVTLIQTSLRLKGYLLYDF